MVNNVSLTDSRYDPSFWFDSALVASFDNNSLIELEEACNNIPKDATTEERNLNEGLKSSDSQKSGELTPQIDLTQDNVNTRQFNDSASEKTISRKNKKIDVLENEQTQLIEIYNPNNFNKDPYCRDKQETRAKFKRAKVASDSCYEEENNAAPKSSPQITTTVNKLLSEFERQKNSEKKLLATNEEQRIQIENQQNELSSLTEKNHGLFAYTQTVTSLYEQEQAQTQQKQREYEEQIKTITAKNQEQNIALESKQNELSLLREQNFKLAEYAHTQIPAKYQEQLQKQQKQYEEQIKTITAKNQEHSIALENKEKEASLLKEQNSNLAEYAHSYLPSQHQEQFQKQQKQYEEQLKVHTSKISAIAKAKMEIMQKQMEEMKEQIKLQQKTIQEYENGKKHEYVVVLQRKNK